jgi:hypothetical protein
MRRLKLWLLIVGALALVASSVAVAHGKRNKTHSDSAATMLTAADAGIKNTTCTGQDGAYREFRSKASGMATGDPRLSGSLRLVAHGVINTTTDRGHVTGWLSIRGERNAAKARFVAVHRDGRLEGYVIGRVHDKTEGGAEDVTGGGRLLGVLTGTIAPNGAFTGKIGGNEPMMASARIQSGGCAHRDDHRGKRKKHR